MRSNNLPAEADLLKRVTVRLIELHEREEFDRRLEADHYLGRCALYGPSVRYVAELDGQYVALYLKARDRWIGWPRAKAPAGSDLSPTIPASSSYPSAKSCPTWPLASLTSYCGNSTTTGLSSTANPSSSSPEFGFLPHHRDLLE